MTRRLARLDAPTDAPAWPNAAAPGPGGERSRRRTAVPAAPARTRAAHDRTRPGARQRDQAAARALIARAPRLTEMDQAVGDGDLGISLARGARPSSRPPTYPLDDPAATLHALGLTLQRSLGGTSGPLYAMSSSSGRGLAPTDPRRWADAFRAGARSASSAARAGERTMLDALIPASEAFARPSKPPVVARALDAWPPRRPGATACCPRAGAARATSATAPLATPIPAPSLACLDLAPRDCRPLTQDRPL